ncbi:hypothetical protein SAMN02787144_105316 [Streptomyces atratus]|uniref:Uncharacterized protein n=1 Tax=Streptomyces atratus TaxID=1893 RepID=A0A1K2FAL1_STRAR|nr:hypothetical protein SAMN02787144_105316 [Streptomyces atratus]
MGSMDPYEGLAAVERRDGTLVRVWADLPSPRSTARLRQTG